MDQIFYHIHNLYPLINLESIFFLNSFTVENPKSISNIFYTTSRPIQHRFLQQDNNHLQIPESLLDSFLRSSNHCFISTNKSPQDTPLFSTHVLCSSLKELSSQSIKLSFPLSSIIHMCYAISWNEFSYQLFFYMPLLCCSKHIR